MSGGESGGFYFIKTDTNHSSSINKLIGEAFKLHCQALSGYEDSMAPNNGVNASTPTMSSLGVEPELETAY